MLDTLLDRIYYHPAYVAYAAAVAGLCAFFVSKGLGSGSMLSFGMAMAYATALFCYLMMYFEPNESARLPTLKKFSSLHWMFMLHLLGQPVILTCYLFSLAHVQVAESNAQLVGFGQGVVMTLALVATWKFVRPRFRPVEPNFP